MQVAKIHTVAQTLSENICKVIVGKKDVIDQVLTALFAGGHILLEDMPGTGKTTLAKSIARSVDCSCTRVQFTPDVMPSDITGFTMESIIIIKNKGNLPSGRGRSLPMFFSRMRLTVQRPVPSPAFLSAWKKGKLRLIRSPILWNSRFSLSRLRTRWRFREHFRFRKRRWTVL